ncbi:hypothetical protein ACN27J_14770 [Solwaraspora sp. WMMB762]|uniref:hypothetical protein n=1 Tax=Solwaraspora sp. WMMB762 TaxID=3404120 RepID=UPI003B94D4A5
MADRERFLRFDHEHRDGLHVYVARPTEAELPGPAWTGLWEQDYPEEPYRNPWRRYAINNNDGEALAVWRAFAWALTAGRSRYAIPAYYRDQAAQLLGIDREAVQLVRWEYEVDSESSEWPAADVGFVPGRACVPMRPPPDQWERDHAGFAGLFTLDSFDDLLNLHLAVAGDASSEVTLFALSDPDRAELLAAALNQDDRPDLADILQPGDIFVDLTVAHDLGFTSTLTVKATEAVEEIDQLADHFSQAFRRYLGKLDRIDSFGEFCEAIDDLLAPPHATRAS